MLEEQSVSLAASDFNGLLTTAEVTIFVGTWNVAGKQLNDSVDLTAWLRPEKDFYDIYVLGLQEIVDLNTKNVLLNDNKKSITMWKKALKRTICSDEQYEVIFCNNLVGLLMICFVRNELVNHIKEVQTDVVKTGFFGAFGNKGNIILRFKINNKNFAFAAAHFCSGQDKNSSRMKELTEILHNPITIKKNSTMLFKNHDFAFVLGDLNFRIALENRKTKYLIEVGDLEKLQQFDQLTMEKEKYKLDKIIYEGVLNFNPTYKYDKNTDDYDTSEKERVPSWTDRVLYSSKGYCEQIFYRRAELKISDHRPVLSAFRVGILERLEKGEFEIKSNSPVKERKVLSEFHKARSGTVETPVIPVVSFKSE